MVLQTLWSLKLYDFERMTFEVQKGNLYILQKKHNLIKINKQNKYLFRPQISNSRGFIKKYCEV